MADEHGSGQDREKKNYYQCSPHSFVVIAYARGFGTDRAFECSCYYHGPVPGSQERP